MVFANILSPNRHWTICSHLSDSSVIILMHRYYHAKTYTWYMQNNKIVLIVEYVWWSLLRYSDFRFNTYLHEIKCCKLWEPLTPWASYSTKTHDLWQKLNSIVFYGIGKDNSFPPNICSSSYTENIGSSWSQICHHWRHVALVVVKAPVY